MTTGYNAILVVDNCDHRLHENMSREVRREGSSVSLLSLDYDLDSSGAQTNRFRLEPFTDDETLGLLSPIYKEKLPDLERIARFAQGFPQMAVLMAEARLNEDPKIGELSDDELAHKMLWRRNSPENPKHLKVLQACSLFDVFGVEGDVETQLEFISSLAGVSPDEAYVCVKRYADRGLIDRRGRYGQLVPKPLAIRLAAQWWTESRETARQELVESIPTGMVTGFCQQIEKMDYHPDVKSLTEHLCGPSGPFGQAEAILSERGSKILPLFCDR